MANAKTNWMKDASGTIFIPKLKPTGSTNKPIYISTSGDITECGPIESVKNNLSFGTKTYNGSTPQTITAADLGIIGAMVYKGTSSTEITDGGTQAPKIGSTTIAIADLKPGNVVLYGQKEFVWNGSKWELLGDEGSYKVKQDAVTTPGASGNSSAFIDTITQDANGKIAVTKKNVDFATINTDLTTLKNKTQHITANADETYFAKDVKVADELITDKIKTTQAFYHFIDGSNKAIATIDANGVTSTSFNGALNGNANTATKLAAARTIQTNLASTSSASFDGSGNVTPGVSGVLGIANGGTGNSAGYIRTGQRSGSTIGNYATAEGNGTVASGENSHAEGYQTEATGLDSHAEGYKTIASGDYSHAEGKYNIEDTENKYAHIVGNGTSDTDRGNAHTLDWDGNAWYGGDVKATGKVYCNDGKDVLLASSDLRVYSVSAKGKFGGEYTATDFVKSAENYRFKCKFYLYENADDLTINGTEIPFYIDRYIELTTFEPCGVWTSVDGSDYKFTGWYDNNKYEVLFTNKGDHTYAFGGVTISNESKGVYVQDTEPADAPVGSLWVDTSVDQVQNAEGVEF